LTFVNEVLLFGLAAAAIPLIIHLFHRSRPRVVRWGAMHLLRASVKSNTRRFRIEQLLLVLIRTAAVLCLALMLARPVLTHLAGLDVFAGGKVARSIVLDVSYSMGRAEIWSLALKRCREALAELSGNDTVRVVLATRRPVTLGDGRYSATRRDEVLELLDRLEPGYAAADLFTAIQEASEELRNDQAAQREIVVVSDFQASSWPEGTAAALDVTESGKEPLRIVLVPVVAESDERTNWSVEGVELGAAIAIAADPVEIRVPLRRHGPESDSEVRVRLTIDDVETLEQTILPGVGHEAEARFQHVFDSQGDYRLEAHIESDALPGDDRFFRVLSVHEVLPVLILDGHRQLGALRKASGFLELALAPFRDDGGGRRNILEPTVVGTEAGELENVSFDNFSVIFMVDVAVLSRGIVARLERFVRDGGGLVIFGGASLKPTFYNSKLHQKGEGMLPASLVAGVARAGDDAVGLVLEAPGHPAMRSLTAFGDDLTSVTVRTWHRVLVNTNVSPRGRPRILASLTSGDPLLVEKNYGDGKVVLCTTACDDDWSNIPMRPWFLPFLHDLALSLVPVRDADLNLRCGDALVQPMPGREGGEVVALRSADGKEVNVKIQPRDVPTLEYRETWFPGFYVVFADNAREVAYAGNVDRAESLLEPIAPATLRTLAEHERIDVVSDDGRLETLFQERQYGKEIWRPLLGLVVALLFLEMFVQQRMGGVRR
jgi:hypothetical protein